VTIRISSWCCRPAAAGPRVFLIFKEFLMFRPVLSITGAGLLCLAGAAVAQVSPDAVSTECDAEMVRELWVRPRPLTPGGYGSRLDVTHIDINSPPEADTPRELAFTPDGGTVAIVNHGTGLIPGMMTFFDVNTRQITHSVEVGLMPNHVAISPDGRYAVCTNVLSHTISVVDVPTRTLIGHVPVTGTQPFRVAITPDSQRAIVSVTNDAVNSSFSVINLATMTEEYWFPSVSQGVMGGYATPEMGISGALWTQWALTPDGARIVLPDRVGGRVVIYDVATGAPTYLTAAPLATSVDISADGTVAVVGHEGFERKISRVDLVSNTITVLNLPNSDDQLQGQVIRITPDKNYAIAAIVNSAGFYSLATGARTSVISTGVVGDIEISYDGQYAFVSNANSRVISIATQSLVATIPLAPCVESATSPTQLRAVALNSRFREDIHLYNINGAASFAEGLTLTGEIPEGDAPRSVAVSPDGRTLVTGNVTSRNVTIVDVPTRTPVAYIDTGDRVLDVAITPDGRYAVSCNTDANTVSVIDLLTHTRVAHLNVAERPSEVRISPDGTRAYVLSVAGTDRVHFINLNGAASSVVGSTLAGQTGNAQYPAYSDTSGIELSPDGSIIAVCVSFEDKVRLIDAGTGAIIADVEVGAVPGASPMEFPMRCAFSPDGSRLYVSMGFGNSVAVVAINGAQSTQIANIPTNPYPYTFAVDPSGQYVYVGTCVTNPGVQVIDAATNTLVSTIPLGAIKSLALHEGVLYAAGQQPSGGGMLWRLNAAGPLTTPIDATPLTSNPSDMVLHAPSHTLYFAQPVPDGVDVVYFGPACSTADFDNDGDAGTDADIEAFFACLAGDCCPTCWHLGADFDGDGDAGTDADIEAFFRVLAGGSC
jgi:YVTN family beta-propeller protein